MNLDDPKLTAFALDELDEPERSIIARSVAESAEAQRSVDETRELARALKNGYAADLENETPESKPVRANLNDIHDDPWFWSIARPLAIAAVIAVAAVFAGAAVLSLNRARLTVASVESGKTPAVEAEMDQSLPELPPLIATTRATTRRKNCGSAICKGAYA